MNLAIDIGNTSVKVGLFEDDSLKELFAETSGLDKVLSGNKIKRVIISQSGSARDVNDLLRQHKITPLRVSYQLPLPIKLMYKSPETLGADRIAGSVAAAGLFPGNSVLKIDFGTCITFDFVSVQQEYLGGAISPGMSMRFKALHNYTAQLPLIDLMQVKSFELLGTDTTSSMVSGVVNGIAQEVNGIIKEYEKRFGKLKVVVTGGDAGIFVTLLKCEIFARPYLVLEGLNRILNYNL